jgi:peptide/nickel transport system permease protein
VINFILKRLSYGVLVLFGVVVVVFFLFNVLPGDPARMMLGQRADEESLKAINRDLGLDKPLTTQFSMYLNDLSPISIHNEVNENHHLYLDEEKYNYIKLFAVGGDDVLVVKSPYLRRSYQTKRKVSELIGEALPETAVLALTAILVATLIGIILGVLAAVNKGSSFDNMVLVLSVFGVSIPSFFTALIFAWVFGFLLTDITGLNMYGSLFTLDDYGNGEYLDLKNLILPAITLGIRPLSIVVQLTRSSLLDVLNQDYIRTARAKGLSYFTVIVKHALKNALNPVITALSGWFASLMAGAVYIEMVFDWKGIGYEIFKATEKYDFPVVMGSVLMIATIFVVINILVDITYGFLDPRVRVS